MLGLQPKADQDFDGISIVPALKGRSLDREAIFCYFPHATAVPDATPAAASVCKGDWKLIRLFFDNDDLSHRYELYNLKDDIGETNNLADRMPRKVRELDALIEQFLRDTDPVLPKPNPAYVAAINGWRGNQHASAAVEDGCLKITSTGGDPWIANRDLTPAEGPFTLELRMKSTSAGQAQAFWATRAHPQFAGQSVSLQVDHDDAWHEYQVELPVEGAATALRLDPSNAPGEIRIEWLRLKDEQGQVVQEWRFR
jgi:hypothetical protein